MREPRGIRDTNLLPDTDVFETVCAENQNDAAHMKR